MLRSFLKHKVGRIPYQLQGVLASIKSAKYSNLLKTNSCVISFLCISLCPSYSSCLNTCFILLLFNWHLHSGSHSKVDSLSPNGALLISSFPQHLRRSFMSTFAVSLDFKLLSLFSFPEKVAFSSMSINLSYFCPTT